MAARPTRVGAFRSGLEKALAEQLQAAGVDFDYEPRDQRIEYEDTTVHKYLPDFTLPNGVVIEAKGRFTAADRKKHLLIRQQHPHLDIRFVFSRSASPLYKGSKTTYADWCEKNGFLYADKTIPEEWMK